MGWGPQVRIAAPWKVVVSGLLLSLMLAADGQAGGSPIGPTETVRKCKKPANSRETCTTVGLVQRGSAPWNLYQAKANPAFVGRVARIQPINAGRWNVYEEGPLGEFQRFMGYVSRPAPNHYDVRSNGIRVGFVVGDLVRTGVWNIYRPGANPTTGPRVGYVKRALPYTKGYQAAGAALGLNLLCTKRAPGSCWKTHSP